MRLQRSPNRAACRRSDGRHRNEERIDEFWELDHRPRCGVRLIHGKRLSILVEQETHIFVRLADTDSPFLARLGPAEVLAIRQLLGGKRTDLTKSPCQTF